MADDGQAEPGHDIFSGVPHPLTQQLDSARRDFFSLRLSASYRTLRRYFDQIPFRVEKQHAELLGMFYRVLADTGRERDLPFYTRSFENHFAKHRDIPSAYGLAYLYSFADETAEETRRFCEKVLRYRSDPTFLARANFLMADHYHWRDDTSGVRYYVEAAGDERTVLWEIWAATALIMEGKLDEAESRLALLRADDSLNWYLGYHALRQSLVLRLLLRDLTGAESLLGELRGQYGDRNLKALARDLAGLAERVSRLRYGDKLLLSFLDDETLLQKGSKTVHVARHSPGDKLIRALAEGESLSKEEIVRRLYARGFREGKDDSLVYYHVCRLREKLAGLEPGLVVTEPSGYRLEKKRVTFRERNR